MLDELSEHAESLSVSIGMGCHAVVRLAVPRAGVCAGARSAARLAGCDPRESRARERSDSVPFAADRAVWREAGLGIPRGMHREGRGAPRRSGGRRTHVASLCRADPSIGALPSRFHQHPLPLRLSSSRCCCLDRHCPPRCCSTQCLRPFQSFQSFQPFRMVLLWTLLAPLALGDFQSPRVQGSPRLHLGVRFRT